MAAADRTEGVSGGRKAGEHERGSEEKERGGVRMTLTPPCELDRDFPELSGRGKRSASYELMFVKLKNFSGEVWLFLMICSVLGIRYVALGWSCDPLEPCSLICRVE